MDYMIKLSSNKRNLLQRAQYTPIKIYRPNAKHFYLKEKMKANIFVWELAIVTQTDAVILILASLSLKI